MKFLKIATVFIIITLTMTSCITINTHGSEIIELETLGNNTDVKDEKNDTNTEVMPEETEPTITEVQTPVTEEALPVETLPVGNIETTPETDSPKAVIELVSITSPISNNKTATVSIKGKPNTEYDINVYYATTISGAKGLENKISDQNGAVSWSWKIGASVKSGSYKIIITDGTEAFETKIQVN